MISPELTIHSYERDRRVVLVLQGELDIASTPLFTQAIAEALQDSAAEVVLDIAKVDFVDSTGLRAILAARSLCADRSCAFALTTPSPSVQRLFEVAGVVDQFAHCETDRSSARAVQLRPEVLGKDHSQSEDGHSIGSQLTSEDRQNGRR